MGAFRQYPQAKDFGFWQGDIVEYAKLKCEQGGYLQVKELLEEAKTYFDSLLCRIEEIPDSEELSAKEPDDLPTIKALREDGARRLWREPAEENVLKDKMAGALIGRVAGCLLGVPVEGMTVENMKSWADYQGEEFPFTDYLKTVEMPQVKNCYGYERYRYQRDNMETAPVDDDITYTQIALLLMERFGLDFSTEQVGKLWNEILPFACTAEEVALKNLEKGLPIDKVGETDNPYCQWIGAAIRSDGFGWAAAGNPEKAAEMAYHDAYLSHRRNGIYGEMFLAAVQSAAFAVSDPLEAVRIGMTEIPRECSLHKDLEWALANCPSVHSHEEARRLVDQRFDGMHIVHTNNNLCLIVFGLHLADGDFLRGISQTVAMGLDSDCTAASVGSILGAIMGKEKIPPHLYERFHNTMETYLRGVPPFDFDNTAQRFIRLVHQCYLPT